MVELAIPRNVFAEALDGFADARDKVSEHVCRLICLCIGYQVSGEISDGDTASRLERVLTSMRIQKKEFDDVTNTYESLIVPH